MLSFGTQAEIQVGTIKENMKSFRFKASIHPIHHVMSLDFLSYSVLKLMLHYVVCFETQDTFSKVSIGILVGINEVMDNQNGSLGFTFELKYQDKVQVSLLIHC